MTPREKVQNLAQEIGHEADKLSEKRLIDWWRKFDGRWGQYCQDIQELPDFPEDLRRELDVAIRDVTSALDIYVRPSYASGHVIKEGHKVREDLQALFAVLSRIPGRTDWPKMSRLDKAPNQYWHCYFGKDEKDPTSYAKDLDLTKDELFRRVVVPWREGREFTLRGRVVDDHSHQKVRRIVRTDQPSSYYEQQQNARLAGSGILGIGGMGFAAFHHGEDFTDDLLTNTSSSSPREANPQGATMTKEVDPREVFVVHGRDVAMNDFFFGLLRALGLKPLEFQTLITRTGSASPYIADVIKTAFNHAAACVVLFTGDELVQLRPELDPSSEPKSPEPQPRPNVLLEAGMAVALQRDRTVIVEVPPLRGLSDLGGFHVVRFFGQPEERNDLASRLQTAGCAVDRSGGHWLSLPFPQSPRGR